ncbi:MAG: hypothetical protein WBG46_12035 [Nonlabens sp.]
MIKDVLIPAAASDNSFFEEIINNSQSTRYHFGSLESDISKFNAVLIHWPEQLFEWQEPTNTQLEQLASVLGNWSSRVPIVHVVHNLAPHIGTSIKFRNLYELVYTNATTIIHLGTYSKNLMEVKYPAAEHVVIEHPLYSSTMRVRDKFEARKLLEIDEEQFVVIVPGTVRSIEERKIILNSFNAINCKNKLLIAPRMLFKRLKPFSGYYKIKKLFPIDRVYDYFANKRYVGSYRFNSRFIDSDSLSQLMSASDVVLVPRFNNLNSGIIYLGLTFCKLIVGPDNGNNSELLERHDMLSYNVEKPIEVAQKLNQAYKQHRDFSLTDGEIDYLRPENIALKWDRLFSKV